MLFCLYLLFILKAFALYDANKNGAIFLQDFGRILESLQVETDSNKIKEIVQQLDTNHDGEIDFDEFVAAMTSLLTREPQDIELRKWNTYPHPPATKGHKRSYSRGISRHETDELRLCFARFDKNGDGLISTQELKQVMSDLGEHLTDREIADMMKDGDTNSDGFIDFKEFKALMPTTFLE